VRYTGALGVLLLATPAQAEQYWSSTRIVQIGAVSQDPSYPQYNDTVYIAVADDKWLPESCRRMPGLLARADDNPALLKLAESAFEHGRPVVVKADDENMIGEFCRFFQITDTAPQQQ